MFLGSQKNWINYGSTMNILPDSGRKRMKRDR
jgi:hypothetical protein